MGTVFSAEHIVLGKRYALKFLRSDVLARPNAVRRFEREAGLLGRLEHENVVNLIDVGSGENGLRYLVLEFIAGHTLRRELAAGALDPERACKILTQVARGLSAAHEAGVIHRDLKPENIMLTQHADGSLLVKLLDFGVACLSESDEALTATGQAPGTAGYMSPEQARGEADLDARSDVFALGVIAYEALCGVRPYDGNSYNETLFRILNHPHTALSQRRNDLSPRVDAVVDRALAKATRDRFGSAWEFVTELREVLREPTAAGQMDTRDEDRTTSPDQVLDDVSLAGVSANPGTLLQSDAASSSGALMVNSKPPDVSGARFQGLAWIGAVLAGLLGASLGWTVAVSSQGADVTSASAPPSASTSVAVAAPLPAAVEPSIRSEATSAPPVPSASTGNWPSNKEKRGIEVPAGRRAEPRARTTPSGASLGESASSVAAPPPSTDPPAKLPRLQGDYLDNPYPAAPRAEAPVK
jgi:serine/threonine-protein kinase